MPASTLDPVDAALRSALTKTNVDNTGGGSSFETQLVGATKKALLANIEFEPAGSYQSNVLDKLKSKYIVLKASAETNNKLKKSSQDTMVNEESLPPAKQELFPLSEVQLGWNTADWAVGAGMVNMGNTCYLNSSLQALFHVPALVNWLIADKWSAECEDSGTHCMICAIRKTLLDTQQRNVNSIRPFLIYTKLRLVNRNLQQGRQEDAHEFLRGLVEAMEKAYLNRFRNQLQFDSRTKETTPLNQVLGGYLRSAVRCLACGHVSTTFQHFQDLLLDIRKAQTLEEALDTYFAREQLDDESYHCEACQKKVRATKQFSLERAPMVLCIQLKRFSVGNNKINKSIQFKQRLELGKYSRSKQSTPLVYGLMSMVTHMGPTVSCGHYTAVAQGPCGTFYQFDDSMVRPISNQAVFNTLAYIMFYELERPPTLNGVKKSTPSVLMTKKTATTTALSESMLAGDSSKTNGRVYGPELPPAKVAKLEEQNGSTNGHPVQAKNSSVDSDDEVERSKENAHSNHKEEVKKSLFTFSNSKPPAATSQRGPSPSTTSGSNGFSNGNAHAEPSSSTGHAMTIPMKKLVPYDDEDDDDSSCDEITPDVIPREKKVLNAKAANGEWSVTTHAKDPDKRTLPSTSSSSSQLATSPAVDVPSPVAASSSSNVVNELYKLSHDGYSAPVPSWNGTKSTLTKEVSTEKREDRKRTANSEADTGRVKHVKSNGGDAGGKSNPGYNPIQEYHNTKNWMRNGSGGSNYYNSNGNRFFNGMRRHRNQQRIHYKNYHNKYRYRN